MISAYEDIREWSRTLPKWQSDALRRLVWKESLTDEDMGNDKMLCLAPQAACAHSSSSSCWTPSRNGTKSSTWAMHSKPLSRRQLRWAAIASL